MKNKKIINPSVIALMVGIALFYYFGISSFEGGTYTQDRSGAIIEFKDGDFIENNEKLGTYSSFYNYLTVHIKMGHVQAIGHGEINNNEIKLDFASYGPSVLTKIEPLE